MKRSSERILTTHTGSLPRPPGLVTEILARENGQVVDEAQFAGQVCSAVAAAVRKQIDTGIDVVNDGEQGRVTYATYVKDRLTGFGGQWGGGISVDLTEYPEFAGRSASKGPAIQRPTCIGPVAYVGTSEVAQEIDVFHAALTGVSSTDTFLSASSPGVISVFMWNHFYPSHEAYLFALADAMKTEYDAIYRAGFLLQLDCPDLAMSRHSRFSDASLEEFRAIAALHVEALNHAVRDIPPDAMRMHLCWGNYEGPHHHDVPLKDIVDVVLRARPDGISFEASNPRHAHEWKVWEAVKLPAGKILIPGVLDSTTNFIEHPELVAQRLVRLAGIVGRENVIAGVDCGFASGAGAATVDPAIAWTKLGAMVEGAQLATRTLW